MFYSVSARVIFELEWRKNSMTLFRAQKLAYKLVYFKNEYDDHQSTVYKKVGKWKISANVPLRYVIRKWSDIKCKKAHVFQFQTEKSARLNLIKSNPYLLRMQSNLGVISNNVVYTLPQACHQRAHMQTKYLFVFFYAL